MFQWAAFGESALVFHTCCHALRRSLRKGKKNNVEYTERTSEETQNHAWNPHRKHVAGVAVYGDKPACKQNVGFHSVCSQPGIVRMRMRSIKVMTSLLGHWYKAFLIRNHFVSNIVLA